jgi:hypothetical protein
MSYLDVYKKLKERERSLTEEKFCTDYLDKSKHYLSMCKSRQIDISDSALLLLYGNLRAMSNSWKQIASTSQKETRSAQNHVFFKELAELVMNELEQRVTH